MSKNVSLNERNHRSDVWVGMLLLGCAALSLLLSNSSWGEFYQMIWKISIGGHPLAHWIDDGLMAVFFLSVGLELKREVLMGKLSSPSRALLPVAAAVGGMLLPAVLYLLLNYGNSTSVGFGIPMSTDIAFVLGVLALLGKIIPHSLKVFLMALAVVDDLGAIVVIAVFYTSEFHLMYFLSALLLTLLLYCMGRWMRTYSPWVYVFGGIVLWLLVMRSGIHASIAGILLALAVPSSGPDAPLIRWERRLHTPVYYVVLPLFVLANTAVPLRAEAFAHLFDAHSLGIMLGLLVGKPVGILLSTWIVTIFGWTTLPEGVGWWHIVGGGFLGGIGFTMAIFVTLLSFENPLLVDSSKLAIFLASLTAMLAGAAVLWWAGKRRYAR